MISLELGPEICLCGQQIWNARRTYSGDHGGGQFPDNAARPERHGRGHAQSHDCFAHQPASKSLQQV